MLSCIMFFVNRQEELARLDRLAASEEGGLVVVYGRRRVGKTRLLLEWAKKHGGVYTVADQSVAEVQRQYFAEALAVRLPGLRRGRIPRLAVAAVPAGPRGAGRPAGGGPLIFDELPYLVLASPELPSVLQRWVDHEAREARLRVAIAGSSQRMMQGFVLSGDAPLFGRAREILEIQPLPPAHLREVFDTEDGVRLVELFTAWGGIPRYWELAQEVGGDVASQVDQLVLDPLGPLHREPDRLLLEEIPSALETRPLLDAIGAGAHRVSEIAGRLGRPATSMARPLDRLVGLGLVRRELPFGESEKGEQARSLQDRRSLLSPVVPRGGSPPGAARERHARYAPPDPRPLLGQPLRPELGGAVPLSAPVAPLAAAGGWGPAARWWHGTQPEWDVVSESLDGKRVLLGEAKWSAGPFDPRTLPARPRELAARPAPPLPSRLAGARPSARSSCPRSPGGRGCREATAGPAGGDRRRPPGRWRRLT